MDYESAIGHDVTVSYPSGNIQGILVEVVDDEGQVFFPFDNSMRPIFLRQICHIGEIIEINHNVDECSYKEVCPHATNIPD